MDVGSERGVQGPHIYLAGNTERLELTAISPPPFCTLNLRLHSICRPHATPCTPLLLLSAPAGFTSMSKQVQPELVMAFLNQ